MRAILVIALTVLLLAGSAPPIQGLAAQAPGVTPVSISIPQILVNTTIEPLSLDPEPSGTWTVGWYSDLGTIGATGNTVLYGYSDYWGSGPSVFFFFDQIGEGDDIQITGSDNMLYEYVVSEIKIQPLVSTEVQDIFGESTDERLTLLGYGGDFDDQLQSYDTAYIVIAKPSRTPILTAELAPAPDETAGCPIALRDIKLSGASLLTPTNAADYRAEIEELGIPDAIPTDQESIDSIGEFLTDAAGCELVARSALTLPDGRILALVGPTGHLSLDSLTVVGLNPNSAASMEMMIMSFAIFTPNNGNWSVEGVPYD